MPRSKPIPASELEIVHRFKQARVEVRAARSYVAAKLGVDSQVIARIELGRAPLKYKLARDFCAHFAISPRWLASGFGAMKLSVALPEAQLLGAANMDLLSEVYNSKLAPLLEPREGEAFDAMANRCSNLADPGMRLWCIDELTALLTEWFRAVPDANVAELKTWFQAAGEVALLGYGRDSWEIEARRRVDMNQLVALYAQDRRPLIDLEASETVRRIVGAGFVADPIREVLGHPVPVRSLWKELLWRLRMALTKAGAESALQRDVGITKKTVGFWSAGHSLPNTETTLRLFAWLAQSEIRGDDFTRESESGLENRLTTVTVYSKHLSVHGQLDSLIERAKRACEPRGSGKRKLLAKFLGVPMPRISEWLNGTNTPGGPTTLRLLEWVTAEEANQQKGSGSAQTPPKPKTRTRKATSNETNKPGRKEK